jgi:transposase
MEKKDMESNKNASEIIETFDHGTLYFIAALCRGMGVEKIFNKYMSQEKGRICDLPHGLEAVMMISNLCDGGYRPLHILQDYFAEKDLEGIFHFPISLDQVNEDRFGHFLDAMYRCGARRIFTDLSTSIFIKYGIKVKNVNYDTTSMVMWGEYNYEDGKTGVVQINFGHSKQKRPDKKQLKMGIGVAEGVVVDAKVLSGNKDDKTYNNENIKDAINMAESMGTPRSEFYYIADSALFTAKNLEKLHGKNGCKYITRIPDNYGVASELIEKGFENCRKEEVIYINKHEEEIKYMVQDEISEYEGYKIKCVLVYSKSLEPAKTAKINKKVSEENNALTEQLDKNNKIIYNSKDEATESLSKIKKPRYHQFKYDIQEIVVNKPGRPSKKDPDNQKVLKYKILYEVTVDEKVIEKDIQRECMFVLTTNDVEKLGRDILLEYKTQISVEKKFQQLKSPHFVHTLYLDKQERIEALCYVLLITLMILSVMEYLVRKGLKEDNDIVIGPGKVKMKSPTLKAIVGIFDNMRIQRNISANYVHRSLFKPLNDSRKKIIKYLGISEESFIWNP